MHKRRKQRVARLGDAARQYDNGGVENASQAFEPCGKVAEIGVQHRFCRGAAVRDRAEENPAVHAALCVCRKQAVGMRVRRRFRRRREGGRRCVLLKAAALAAGAGAPARVKTHVPDLTRTAVRADNELTARDDAAAHARAERDQQQVVSPAHRRFTERGAVGVVAECHSVSDAG